MRATPVANICAGTLGVKGTPGTHDRGLQGGHAELRARVAFRIVREITREVRERQGGALRPRNAPEITGRALLKWPPIQRIVADAYHRLYYYNPAQTWYDTRWLGHEIRKLPLDTWIYQEIIYELRPDLIIETGTRFGGSALYMAHICDLIGHGDVVTVDVAAEAQPGHPRITYLAGSSTDPTIISAVKARARGAQTVMVVLDSLHLEDHVKAEIAAYKDLVTVGSYLIVEDGDAGGHPVHHVEVPDGGPAAAIRHLLDTDTRFAPDHRRERYFVTQNPHGYLRRMTPPSLA
jgi:cephalosporin hydroxylase